MTLISGFIWVERQNNKLKKKHVDKIQKTMDQHEININRIERRSKWKSRTEFVILFIFITMPVVLTILEIKEILNLKEYKETKDWYHYGYGAMYLISVGYLLYTRAGTLKLRDLNEYFDQNTINQIEIQATKLTTKDNNQNATKMQPK